MNLAMDGRGTGFTRRRRMWSTVLASAGAMLAGCSAMRGGEATAKASDAPFADARTLLEQHFSVDVHTHGGPTGVVSRTGPTDDLARGMRAGRVAIVCLADVPAGPILGRDASNVLRAVR